MLDALVVNEIRDRLQKLNEFLQRCSEFFENILVPQKEIILDALEKIYPNRMNFISQLKRIEDDFKNTAEILKLISQYEQELDGADSWSTNYSNLLKNSVLQIPCDDFFNCFEQMKNSLSFETSNDNVLRNIANSAMRLIDLNNNYSLNNVLHTYRHLNNFSLFKNLEKNFVIIGANGAGKSSFSRRTREILGGNVVIIASQKIFSFHPLQNLPFGSHVRRDFWNHQAQDKLYKEQDRFGSNIEKDLQMVIESLFEEENECAQNLYHGIDQVRKKSILEQVCELWSKILIHRSLKVDKGNILVFANSDVPYPFMSLSDGEKAVFYYIAHILLAKPNSYIIVDEPENHLHLALVVKLWDSLESARPDCQFIYLTHNLDFATSRNNVQRIWMQKYVAPDYWEMSAIPIDVDIPDNLFMELLGSRSPILFCEGTKASLDYKLYTRLFPDYTIVPVGGHLQVISSTKAFNNCVAVHKNRAIGIVDGDFFSLEQKEKWKSDFIYSLDVQEVENILCDETVLNEAQNSFCANGDSVKNAKKRFFECLERNIDDQCLEYAVQTINNRFKENFLAKPRSVNEMKENLSKLSNSSLETVDSLIDERKKILQKILEEKNYEEGVKKFNNKGLVGSVATLIEKDYRERIFILLDKRNDILQHIRGKYFSNIPNINELDNANS